MLVTPEDLVTELYPEVVNEITRTSKEEQEAQIRAAEDFAKGFLFKYDLKALFGTVATAPTVKDEGLKKCIKIIAAYFLVRKANPAVQLDLFRDDYMMMIGTKEEPGWLYEIRNGAINPEWPYKPDDPDTPDIDESTMYDDVYWTSTKKRINRF
ncbi:hypothetical protein OK18_19150 [Chryseobacterium gallinarum]|uniref:DUF1320 domain-containing protein n=1 Tax=Chryseobacterium gallinarum TaxID=1324352 RepID=A0A0G3M788_CHRGL|nr:hypothetical protein [Chryseobacterium gallinarum]AKK74450.1 hypothetical protein OK18_19150 [Chryseobacterium gallinarum]